jgi:hypothetical protein
LRLHPTITILNQPSSHVHPQSSILNPQISETPPIGVIDEK